MMPISSSVALSAGPVAALLTAASCALVVVTAPLAIELLACTAGSLLPRRPGAGPRHAAAPLAITVVVPAHNEEVLVGRCVRSLRADLPVGGAVLVVAHNCSDSTAVVAASAGAEVLILDDDSREGKGAALRAGFAHAAAGGAAVLAVVDADSVVSPGFFAAIAGALERGADAFQSRYVVMGADAESRTRLTALGFLGFNVVRPRGRSRLGLSAGIFGNGFGFRAAVLDRVPYEASSLVEDLEYHLRLVEAGIKVDFLEWATVSSEMPSTNTAAASQRARWEGGRLRMARVWLPRLLRSAIRGKWRLVEPALDLASQPLASEVMLLGVALLLPVPWLRLYALAAFAVLLAHVATAAAEESCWWMAFRTLLSVPGYILWKLWMVPRTLASARRNAAWVRTSRETLPASRTVLPTEISAGSAARSVAGGAGKAGVNAAAGTGLGTGLKDRAVGELIVAGPAKASR